MSGIFVFAEESALGKQLLTPALELKQSLSEPITALTSSEADAKELAALGADKVLVLQSASRWTEGLSEAIYGLVSGAGATILVVGGTLRGKHVASCVAAKLNAGMTTDAKSLKIDSGKLLATRLFYGGLALCEEELTLPAVVTIPPRTFLPPSAAAKAGAVESVKAEADGRVAISEITRAEGTGVDIGAATRLVSVGRGFRKQEDLKLAEDLAAALKAELSCSRPVAEDEHWLPINHYVGISGHTVKPELYLAVGISGQVQHMVGARESKVIVAVNNDEQAPIFEAADYGIVGDLYEVLPLLTAAVKK
ncbi:MAG TPA: electron transfer flavoprotein subunit alpha/FixB family protein [Silvibacterium sp.]|nr:electron transfer flavoprotein subunit alpha/FixB family protein [Silvibacterium sp.]